METYINKIVEQPIKVDLHIHSEYSITKDSKELIGEGTKEDLNLMFVSFFLCIFQLQKKI